MSCHIKYLQCLYCIIKLCILILLKKISCTIDINAPELQYLADHLTPEECRRLIAAAHFKSYQEPNALDQAERKVSKDVSCIDLLYHWNSQAGEGKGQTHELLEHRLRQMGKYELADWLGKTVFHELAVDLNRSLESGLHEFGTESTEGVEARGATLAPIVENSDPSEWSAMDSVLYAGMVGLIAIIIVLCCKLSFRYIYRLRKDKQTRRVKFKQSNYEIMEGDTTDTESEDRFDVRDYSGENRNLMKSPG